MKASTASPSSHSRSDASTSLENNVSVFSAFSKGALIELQTFSLSVMSTARVTAIAIGGAELHGNDQHASDHSKHIRRTMIRRSIITTTSRQASTATARLNYHGHAARPSQSRAGEPWPLVEPKRHTLPRMLTSLKSEASSVECMSCIVHTREWVSHDGHRFIPTLH
jgi:hypothetical protein